MVRGHMPNKNPINTKFILAALALTMILLPLSNAITLPAKVIYYSAITVNNVQTSGFLPNSQIAIPYNALKYQSYETHSLNNTEFFYANGTLIPSWLEGNTLNEKGNANILYKSANVLFWVRIYPSNIMFPASTANTIYIGWSGNVATASNTLMDGITVGESPLLSSSYGVLDDGANVFTQYGGGGSAKWSKFTFLDGTWLTTNGYLQQTAAATNTLSGGTAALIESTSYPASGTYILEMTFNYTTQRIARVGIIAVATPSGGDVFGYRFIGQQTSNGAGFLSFLNDLVTWVVSNTYEGSLSTPYTMSVNDVAGKWSGSLYSGYGLGGTVLASLASTTYTSDNNEGVNTGYVGISATYYNGASTVSNPINVQWFRMRTYPPSGVMPTITFKAVQSLLAATPNPYTASNKTIDVSQGSVANTVISNGASGTASYTGNWFWSAPNTVTLSNTPTFALSTANNALTLTINAVSSNSVRITANALNPTIYYANAVGTNTIYGTWTFNAFAGDSNGDLSPSPALTNTITINPAFSIGAITPSAPSIDNGQSIALAANPSGGTAPYSYQWYTGTACNTILSGNTLQTYTPSPTSNIIYSVKVTDSASTQLSICSSGDTVTVNPALGTISAPSVSAAKLDVNQAETVTGTMPSTGTSPYTYNWLVSVNNGIYAAATQCGANSGSGQISGNTVSCVTPANTLTVGDTYSFKLKVTDGSVTPSTATSSASPTVSVSSQLTAATPTVSAPRLDYNQAEAVTGTIPSTGTSSYTYNWLVSTNGGSSYSATTPCQTTSGSGQPAGNTVTCSILPNTLTINSNYIFELRVTDSATTPNTVASPASQTVSVSSRLSAIATPSASASNLDVDQVETITGTIPSTGTSPYSYSWQISVDGGTYTSATQCAQNTGSNQISNNAVACTVPGNTLTAGDTYNFELEAADSATTQESASSSPSITINAYTQLTAPSAPTVSSPKLDRDQLEAMTGTMPSTGTSPYTYNWLVSTNGGSSYSLTTPCATTSGAGQSSGNTVTCNIAANTLTVSANYLFELRVTDSATNPESINSQASSVITVASQLAAPNAPIISSNSLFTYQVETINGIIPSTGTPPYSYTWHISTNNGIYAGATQCTQNTGSGQSAGSTVTCTIPSNVLSGGNIYNFALEVVDSATAQESSFSASSNTITVVSPATVNAPSLSANALDSDQEEIVTGVMPSAGAAPYSYSWLVSTNGGYFLPTTQCTANSGTGQANGNTVLCSIFGGNLIASNAYSFELQVTDSNAHTTASAPTVNVAVEYPLAASPAPLISAAKLDVGQTETITDTIPSTGTAPYAYTWHISTDGGAVYSGATQCTQNTGTGQSPGSEVTCTIPGNTLSPGTTYNFALEVTDSATAQESSFSASSNSIAVSSQLGVPSTPIISNMTVDLGQIEMHQTSVNGGTPPYTYNIISVSTSGNTIKITSSGPINTPIYGGPTISLGYAYTYVIVTDSATTPEATQSANSIIYLKNPALTPSSNPIASATNIDSDQIDSVTSAMPSTGSAPYSYSWQISVNNGAYFSTTQCAVNTGTGQSSGNAVTCAIPGNTLASGDTYSLELEISDSANTPEAALSAASNTITVYSLLSAPSTPTISASRIDADQSETINGVIPYTGEFPYSYNWLLSTNGGASYTEATQCATYSGSGQSAGNTVTCAIPGSTLTGGNTYTFELQVSDSASTPETVKSPASSNVAVSPQLTPPAAPGISSSNLDIDQAETVTGVIPSTGTPTYSYAWYVSVNNGAYAAATQCGANSGSGQSAGNTVTCAVAADALTIGNTYNFKLQVSDGSPTAETSISPASSTVAVSSQLTTPAAPSISIANLDSNEAETITDTIPSTGTAPYAYTWHISTDGGAVYSGATQCTQNTGSGQSPGSEVTCTIPGNTLSAGTTYNFALEVTDSASVPEGAFSLSSNAITVYSPLTAPSAPVVYAPKLDSDEAETVTGTIPSTGISPYSYNWLVSINNGAYVAATQCATYSGSVQSAGSTATCTIPGSTLSAGSTYSFKLQVSDSASTPEIATSPASSGVVVSSQLTISTAPTISDNDLDVFQTETINGIIPSTGTPPYSYTWHISTDGGTYAGATQCTANTGSGQSAGSTVTCTIPRNTLSGGNFYNFALEVVDSATTQESAFSASSNTITVISSAVANAPAVSATALDSDQEEIVTGIMPATGTPPYTYNWLISANGGYYLPTTQCTVNSGTGQANGNTVLCSILGGNLIATNTYSFKLQVTDSDAIPDTTNSLPTANVAVASPLTTSNAPLISDANLDADQVETINGNIPSTGTPPYSYTWHISTDGGAVYFGATQCTQNTGSGQSAGNTVTCAIPGNTLASGDTYNFALEVVDSATAQESSFSASSNAITVYSPIAAPSTPAVSEPKLDFDQAETVTGTMPSAGISPYTYNWLVSTNGGSSYSATTPCQTTSGSGQISGNTVTCTIAGSTLSTINTYIFKLQVSDSVQPPEIATSSASPTITVSPQLTPSTQPGISSPSIYAGQSESITSVMPSTGIAPYSYTWHISTDGGAVYSGATQCTVNTGSGQSAGNTVTCIIPGSTLAGGNSYNFALEVVDSATDSESAFSLSSNTITVVASPTATSLTPSASLLTIGQQLAYSVLISGGVGPFTVNLVASNGTVINTLTGQSAGTLTFGLFIPPIGTDSYNVIATDTGSLTPFTFSSAYNAITLVQRAGGAYPTSATVLPVTAPTTSTATSTIATTTTISISPQRMNATGNNVSVGINASSSGASTIVFNKGQATLYIQSPEAGFFNITIVNVTGNSAAPLSDYSKLIALRINITSTLAHKPILDLPITLRYNCRISPNDIAPFMLSNGTWHPISPFTVNSSACSVSFSIRIDPIVALFELLHPSTSNTTTAAPTTTVPAAPTAPPGLNLGCIAAFLVVIAIIILVYLASRRRKRWR
jgi:hypothetical protein